MDTIFGFNVPMFLGNDILLNEVFYLF